MAELTVADFTAIVRCDLKLAAISRTGPRRSFWYCGWCHATLSRPLPKGSRGQPPAPPCAVDALRKPVPK